MNGGGGEQLVKVFLAEWWKTSLRIWNHKSKTGGVDIRACNLTLPLRQHWVFVWAHFSNRELCAVHFKDDKKKTTQSSVDELHKGEMWMWHRRPEQPCKLIEWGYIRKPVCVETAAWGDKLIIHSWPRGASLRFIQPASLAVSCSQGQHVDSPVSVADLLSHPSIEWHPGRGSGVTWQHDLRNTEKRQKDHNDVFAVPLSAQLKFCFWMTNVYWNPG